MTSKILSLIGASLLFHAASAFESQDTVKISITDNHDCQCFEVSMQLQATDVDTITLNMPRWTPGYYQIMDYPNNVFDFDVRNQNQNMIAWRKQDPNHWKFVAEKGSPVDVRYKVKSAKPFVAKSSIHENMSYMVMTGLIMHPSDKIKTPIVLTLHSKTQWTTATGLHSKEQNVFLAKDFDELYDSPILAGALETLEPFFIDGIPHYFKGFKLGEFDRRQFVRDLQKIVEASVGIIDDIPYKDYTFIGIGPGQGGIEHSNSTTVSFEGNGLSTRGGQLRMYSFLAHEYFHHYNVKRIRPIELGPFDYNQENRTKQLWISEGITVYYDHLILVRAGLSTPEEFLKSFSDMINHYEAGTGKNYQTLADASYETWSDGPFGRQGDGVNKTISVYEKGAIVALLLDLRIRQETKGKKSLDDVMKTLYHQYYKKQNRGFTEQEFTRTCEDITNSSLADFFDYIYTLTPIDYSKYFDPVGISFKDVPEGKGKSLSLVSKATKVQGKALETWFKK